MQLSSIYHSLKYIYEVISSLVAVVAAKAHWKSHPAQFTPTSSALPLKAAVVRRNWSVPMKPLLPEVGNVSSPSAMPNPVTYQQTFVFSIRIGGVVCRSCS